MASREEAVLVLIDVQGKLAESMHEKERLFSALEKLIRGFQVLELPIIVTEQVPEKLGSTQPRIAELFSDAFAPLPKKAFSCAKDQGFAEALAETGRQCVVLCGIESHVCVYQTAVDLLSEGFTVELVVDAVSSRSETNKNIAIERLKSLGIRLTTVEMLLFELLEVAEGQAFREVVRLVK